MNLPPIRIALPLLAAALLFTVVLQNLEPLEVRVLFFEPLVMSKATLVGLSAFLGLLAGLPLGLRLFRRR